MADTDDGYTESYNNGSGMPDSINTEGGMPESANAESRGEEAPEGTGARGGSAPDYPEGGGSAFSFGTVIRESAECYKRGFLKLLLLVLLVTLPAAILQVFFVDMNFEKALPSSLFIDSISEPSVVDTIAQELSDFSGKLMLYLGITALLSSLSLITEAGAVILAGSTLGTLYVPDNSSSHMTSAKGDVSFSLLSELSFRSFPKLLLTMLLTRLFMVFGLMLCVLPGIFIYYVTIFAVYSVELTGLWGRKAIFVSTLCTRKYPRASALFALLFLIGAEVLLSLAVSGISSLIELLVKEQIISGIFEVLLICVKQMAYLFFTTCGAVLFSKMLTGVGPLIEQSGIRGKKRGS